MADKRILWYLFHPNFSQSVGNRALLDAVRDLPGLTLVDAYAEYPDFKIDAKREQERLVAHDLIVFQHPFYWYSSPALFKEWQDIVLEYGFAYPPKEGKALHGKHWLSVVTAASTDWSYQAGGFNNYTMSELLRPFQQTANFCGMRWHSPFVVYGVMPDEYEGIKPTDRDALTQEAQRLRELIVQLDLEESHSLEPLVAKHYLAAKS